MFHKYLLLVGLLALVVGMRAQSIEMQNQVEHNSVVFSLDRPIITFHNDDDTYGIAFPDFDLHFDLPEAGPPLTERYEFDFPASAEIPFDHIQFDWNPMGHPGGFSNATTQEFLQMSPEDQMAFTAANSAFFTVPHFDVHFHMKSISFVEAISCSDGFPPCQATDEELARFSNTGPMSYYPEDHFLDPTAFVPHMGSHIERDVDKDRTEFTENGEFIFGSYDGEPLFWEPMHSLAQFREIKNDAENDPSGVATVTIDIPQPDDFFFEGFYPREYELSYSVADELYVVKFSDTEYRDSSGPLVDAANQLVAFSWVLCSIVVIVMACF